MKECENALIASKNEIAIVYSIARRQAGIKCLPSGNLGSIIKEITVRNALSEGSISESCIRQRVKKQKLCVAKNHSGTLSPLHNYEDTFVRTLIQMARMRQSLSPSQCVNLINSMITGTDAETALISF